MLMNFKAYLPLSELAVPAQTEGLALPHRLINTFRQAFTCLAWFV